MMESVLTLPAKITVMRKYDPVVKARARAMVSEGILKADVARELGIPSDTVVDWTRDMPLFVRMRYPRKAKLLVRKLAKAGVTKRKISKMANVAYATVVSLTKDIKSKMGRFGIRGKALELLRTLVERGYLLPTDYSQMIGSVRTLKKYLPIKRARVSRAVVWYLQGSERTAMEAMLEKLQRKSIRYDELSRIRQAFGIKKMKRGNNKIRERFL